MIIEGTAIVIRQDNVNTDVLYPGRYLNIDHPEEMKLALFEGLNPSLRDELEGETILCVGENFGSGSSREQVAQSMKASGIQCVVGKSFARIFHRNCVNLGLPIVTCSEATETARAGSRVLVDTDSGAIEVDGRCFQAAPIPSFMLDMFSSGGLVPWARRRLGARCD